MNRIIAALIVALPVIFMVLFFAWMRLRYGPRWQVIYPWGKSSGPVSRYNAERIKQLMGGEIKRWTGGAA